MTEPSNYPDEGLKAIILLEAYKRNIDPMIADLMTRFPCHELAAKRRIAEYIFNMEAQGSTYSLITTNNIPIVVNWINALQDVTNWSLWEQVEMLEMVKEQEYK